MTLFQEILDRVLSQGTKSGLNVVAFSGGVDSSLTAFFVHRAFAGNSAACIGISPSLSSIQLSSARSVAEHIGIGMLEVETHEGDLESYIANEGQSCYLCKKELYSTLKSIHQHVKDRSVEVVLFNGTNADDLLDSTRVGLRAAAEFSVASPLDSLSKSDVRALARYVGLPNWNVAASPCLRSRLQSGVRATPENLSRIEGAEDYVRSLLGLTLEHNIRVRHLHKDMAQIELDPQFVERLAENLSSVQQTFRVFGFEEIRVREFSSGALNGVLPASIRSIE